MFPCFLLLFEEVEDTLHMLNTGDLVREDWRQLADPQHARRAGQVGKLTDDVELALGKYGQAELVQAAVCVDEVDEGLRYDAEKGLEVKNFLWVLVEDIGLDKLKSMVKKPLTGLKAGPFYGCYILRPEAILGFDDHPDRDHYLEYVIEALGCTLITYEGQDKCCGFPILTINKKNSLTMAANHLSSAQEEGADCLVTPCPLCHLNLDAQQPDAAKYASVNGLEVPILHLPQLIGLALGMDPKALRVDRHVVSSRKVLANL